MKKIFLLSSLFLLHGCIFDVLQKRDGKFLADVVNLEEFNSEFDDYNSDLPYNKSGSLHLTFSSKRTKKNVLNLVNFDAKLTYDKRLDLKKYNGGTMMNYNSSGIVPQLTLRANGNFNVFGPKVISFHDDLTYYQGGVDDVLLFYADDSEGNM
jgi:hypothetical protein